MRRLILTALVLLPALASAQTSTSAAKPSDAANLQAKLTAPAPFRPVSAPAAAAAASSADNVMVPIHQTVIDNSTSVGDSVGYSYNAGRPVAPKLIYSVPLQLSLKDMRSEPDTATTIVVRVTVLPNGTTDEMSVVQSGGATLDKRALEAAAQYRFQPATENNIPVAASATIAFTLKKS